MKVNKHTQKLLFEHIKERALAEGYKKSSVNIYKKINDNFIVVDYLVVNSTKILYQAYVKKYSYDPIFWTIMKMEENLKKRDSLRATGAFRAPAVLVKEGEYELTEEVLELAQQFITEINDALSEYIKENDVNQRAIIRNNSIDSNILQCLAYIDINEPEKALKIAKEEIANGDRGRFKNKEKGFFEWTLEYLGENKA